ncbi:hypothetical protein PMAYCL1PPCAC_28006, partial [Pristionchus mayeri]
LNPRLLRDVSEAANDDNIAPKTGELSQHGGEETAFSSAYCAHDGDQRTPRHSDIDGVQGAGRLLNPFYV